MDDASKIIDQKLASLTDWRGATMKVIRKLIHEVAPDIVEEWKWMGTPVWNHNGIICIANAHKQVVKVTFSKGAKLPDPQGVFNAGLGGNAWRAIDLSEGDTLNSEGFKGLVRAAMAVNDAKPAARKPGGAGGVTAKKPKQKPKQARKPPAKKPADQKATAKKPATKTPATRKPIAKAPTSKRTAGKK